jgi:hypothetical protein
MHRQIIMVAAAMMLASCDPGASGSAGDRSNDWSVEQSTSQMTVMRNPKGIAGLALGGPSLLMLSCLSSGRFIVGLQETTMVAGGTVDLSFGDQTIRLEKIEAIVGQQPFAAGSGKIDEALLDVLTAGKPIVASVDGKTVGPFDAPVDNVMAGFAAKCRSWLQPAP